MPSVLVPLANGSEELEAISITNPLRRAGVDVTVAAISTAPNDDSNPNSNPKMVTCARGTKIECDVVFNEELITNKNYDLVCLPGGMPGAQHFHECKALVELLKRRKGEKKWNAAICASPAVVFAQNGIVDCKSSQPSLNNATCYPNPKFHEMLYGSSSTTNSNISDFEGLAVVVDEEAKIITSVGPGTALEFGLRLVGLLCGKEKMLEIGKGMKFQGVLE